jgi:NTE family protein
MDDHGLTPGAADVVVGTSAGSIVAATVRRHAPHTPEQPVVPHGHTGVLGGRAGALQLVRRPRQALNALLLAPELANGRVSTEFLTEALRASHGDAWPDAATWIVAVRRSDGRRTVFGLPDEPTTDVASAVAASCAIPGYLSAVEIDGVSYVDGGVHSPTNADLLAGCELDAVVVSSPMSMELSASAIRPRVDLPLRLLFHRYVQEEVWALRGTGTRVVTIEPDAAVLAGMGWNMMHGENIDEIEEAACELARGRLAELVHPQAA